MKHAFRLSLSIAAFALLSFTLIRQSWVIPTGSKASFRIDGLLGIDAKGGLSFDSSAIRFDPAHPEEGSMYVSLATASINTGIRKRDRHLRTEDFLDAEKYPQIRFVSSAIQPAESGYLVSGALTIRDVTKHVTIPFTFENRGDGGVFKGAFTINRLDFGVGEKYRKSIGKEVRIKLEVPVQPVQ